jgi:hypothetical protein
VVWNAVQARETLPVLESYVGCKFTTDEPEPTDTVPFTFIVKGEKKAPQKFVLVV